MPQAIPMLTYYVATQLGYTALVATIIATAVSVVVSQYQRRQAEARARDAYNASLTDRLVMTETTSTRRSRLYGTVRNVDGIVFKGASGADSRYYTLVVAVAGHEVDAITKVYLNDTEVTLSSPDGSGWQNVTSNPWLKNTTDDRWEVFPAANGVQTHTLPDTPLPGSVYVLQSSGAGDNSFVNQIGFTQSGVDGRDITFDAGAGAADNHDQISIHYHVGVGTPKVKVRKFLGAPGQDLHTFLAPSFPSLITAADTFQGIAGVIVQMEYDTDVFPTGVPSVSVEARGAKIYDPRTGLTQWSDNPALISRDWATYEFGGGLPTSVIDDGSVIAAANACDVQQTFHTRQKDGTTADVTRKTYLCGIVASTETDPEAVLDDIVLAMAGAKGWSSGKLRFRAGAYRVPVATITEDWLSGSAAVEIVPEGPMDEAINTVRPTISDEAQLYVPTPLEEVPAPAYITADGRTLPRDITFNGITSAVQAQHVSGVIMREARSGLVLNLPCNLRALQLELFDTVYVTLSRFGFVAKEFEVVDWKFTVNGGVMLSLKETAASIYDPDASFLLSDATPNTTLPSPFLVPGVQGLAATSSNALVIKQQDGTIVPRIQVTWTAINDAAVAGTGEVEVRYGLGATSEEGWTSVKVPGGSTSVLLDAGIEDGRIYLVKARAANKLVRGPWSTYAIVLAVGKSSPPLDVQGLNANTVQGGVLITWSPNTEVDYAETELRFGSSWSTGTRIFKGAATAFTWTAATLGSFTILAKHRDTSGNESINAVSVGVVVDNWALLLTGGNLLDASSWVIGTSDTQGTFPRRFRANGTGAESTIQLLTGPDGVQRPVWRSTSADVQGGGASDGDGGWDSDSFAIDHTKMYRFSVWVRPSGVLDGSAYLGVQGSTVRDIGGGVNTNPYFVVPSRASLVSNRWYLAVGYVLPSSYGGAQQNLGGLYDGVTGQKVLTGTDFRWVVNQATSAHRSYQYYASVGAVQDFWGPRVELCDGAEPTLDELLSVSLSGRVVAAQDVVLVARGNCEVIGNLARKATGVSAWDSDVYSRDAFTGGGFASVMIPQTDAAVMFGLNSDPTTDQNYTSIDFALYCDQAANLSAYESGSGVSLGTYAAGDVLAVVYDGSVVRYLKNGSVLRTVNAPPGLKLFFDSSFWSRGGVISGIRFGPLTSNNWASIGGSGKPADNATNDLVLIPRGNCGVVGNTGTKNGGVSAWDSDIYSRDSYTGGAFVSGVFADPSNNDSMLGLNADPTTDKSYTSLDYAFRSAGGTLQIYESGVLITTVGALAANDVCAIAYDGSRVVYMLNGVVVRSISAAAGLTLFLDTSFNQPGSTIQNMRHGPLSANNWSSVGGRPKQFRVISRGGSDTALPAGLSPGFFNAETGSLWGAARSYTMHRIRRSDQVVTFSRNYDVYGVGATGDGTAADLAADLNATTGDIVVVYTYDEPQAHRTDSGLLAAMKRCGASDAVFGSPQFQYRSAYILVGIAGCGAGNGFEAYQGSVSADTNAWCDVSFLVTAQGQLIVSGTGATPRTLADYSYTGSLDATRNRIWEQSSDPGGSAVDGDVWKNTSSGKSYLRVGGAWKEIVGAGSVGTTELGTGAATDVYQDVVDFAGTGFGTAVARTFVVTPTVAGTIEFTASISADNINPDAGNQFRWEVTPSGGSTTVLGYAGGVNVARTQYSAVASFAVAAGVSLTFAARTVKSGATIHLWESNMRVTLVKR